MRPVILIWMLLILHLSSEQVCKTGWQDNVEITDSFQALFNAENTVLVKPQIFLSSSFTN